MKSASALAPPLSSNSHGEVVARTNETRLHVFKLIRFSANVDDVRGSSVGIVLRAKLPQKVMDPTLRRRMLAYYDKRAPDYEQAYTEGTGTSSIGDRSVFTGEAEQLAEVVRTFGTGHLIDVACGSGYWLRHYASRCGSITLIDQSANMLRECEAKVRALGIVDRCALVQGDVLEYAFPAATYDTALIGFLISHLSEEQERGLFESLRHMLRPEGHFLILDSGWTQLRARFNTKADTQTRRLNDGTESRSTSVTSIGRTSPRGHLCMA